VTGAVTPRRPTRLRATDRRPAPASRRRGWQYSWPRRSTQGPLAAGITPDLIAGGNERPETGSRSRPDRGGGGGGKPDLAQAGGKDPTDPRRASKVPWNSSGQAPAGMKDRRCYMIRPRPAPYAVASPRVLPSWRPMKPRSEPVIKAKEKAGAHGRTFPPSPGHPRTTRRPTSTPSFRRTPGNTFSPPSDLVGPGHDRRSGARGEDRQPDGRRAPLPFGCRPGSSRAFES